MKMESATARPGWILIFMCSARHRITDILFPCLAFPLRPLPNTPIARRERQSLILCGKVNGDRKKCLWCVATREGAWGMHVFDYRL